jgi:DNA-binding winged helix-turn-helix (wHTH) protein
MQVRFGPFVFDSEARELRRDREPVHLSPKAFQLLEALLDSRPRALSKSDLHDRLWPKTFVVEANLANLVAEVRGVLGDDPRQPRFVRTVHGFGYAFREPPSADASPGIAVAAREALPLCRVVWGKRVIPLEPGENVLGRGEGVAVRIEAPGVSRRHARILVGEGQAMLEDLGSKNGTYLREQRLAAPALLSDGDTFRVGRQMLVFHSQPADGSTLTEGGSKSNG